VYLCLRENNIRRRTNSDQHPRVNLAIFSSFPNADADSESVEELVEEGNAFEAEAVEGVEDAKPPDVSEVKTREVPEDDVPAEYLNNDKDVA
jgi:hypothetical protein